MIYLIVVFNYRAGESIFSWPDSDITFALKITFRVKVIQIPSPQSSYYCLV